jgi:hypothetical protein
MNRVKPSPRRKSLPGDPAAVERERNSMGDPEDGSRFARDVGGVQDKK